MDAQTIEKIETRIAFLERANNELSDVVYRQQKEIDELQARLQVLSARLDAALTVERRYTPEEERPPHY